MQSNQGVKLFNFIFFLVAVLKVFLIADQEIFGQRFDDMGYALSIIDFYYACDPNLNWLFIRPLGFPVFGALCMESGIPYRLCIESLFLGACYFFCSGLIRLIRLPIAGIVSLLALVFHPWVLVGFNQLLTEPFYFCLILFLSGTVFHLLSLQQWSWKNQGLWWIGALAALMMLTRREEPWMLGLILLLFGSRILLVRFRWDGSWNQSFNSLLLGVIPVAAFVAVMLCVSTFNYAKWGIFATNEQQAPGFSGLLDTLYEIDTPDPSIWAPVTSRTLEMAMEASPRFALLRDGLFNTNNPHLEYGEMTTGRKGELGAWMWWRLYESLAGAGIYTSPKAADEWMRETTAELQTAFEDGRLPRRSFSTSFPLDPNFGIWLPRFPALFLNTVKRLHFQQGEPDFATNEAEVPSMYLPLFDKAANRRISLIGENSFELTGHAFSSAGRLDFIAVENGAGEVVASTSPQGFVYWKKPDIERLAGKGEFFETAFALRFIPRSKGPFTLSLWKDGTRLHAWPLSEREFPYRKITAGKDSLPAVDLTVLTYRAPFPEQSETMKALLRGWSFADTGPLTHVSLVNSKGQFLKLEEFKLHREDVQPLYEEATGMPPVSELGFHVETPVLDDAAIKVQFWMENLLVHELDLDELPEGLWERIEETASGIPITLGVGRRQMPEIAEITGTFRERIRANLIRNYYSGLIGTGLVLAFALMFFHSRRSRDLLLEPCLVATSLIFLFMLLLGRALFYGLVEAAVVPDVSRYMDCVSPLASVLLVLLVFMAALLLYEAVVQRIRQVGPEDSTEDQ